jgi:arylamine N-acetyltransferase
MPSTFNAMDIAAYFERIGLVYNPAERPGSGLLRRLQFAHVTSAPYENADIVRGIPLSLNVDDLYKKIVTNRRGGYCFELNGLFRQLLREVGFNVKAEYFARFLRGEKEIPMRRHRVIRVEADGRDLIADVGIGNVAPRYPLLLEEGIIQEQFGETYRFRRDDFLGWVLTELHKGSWRDVFSFTEEPQLGVDFEATSFFCERHPSSPFNKEWMFSIKTENGRKTLDGKIFKVFVGDEPVEIKEIDEEEIPSVMKDVFGIEF